MLKNEVVQEMYPEEDWRIIKDYPSYVVSDAGKVYSFKHRKLLKATIGQRAGKGKGSGYIIVRLYEWNKTRDFKVHRLVAEAFIPNPENKRTVNHINGDRTDNRVENLEWATDSENMIHAFKEGLIIPKFGEENKTSKAVVKIDRETREVLANYGAANEAARECNIAASGILAVCRKEMHHYKSFYWMFRDDLILNGVPNPLPKYKHYTKRLLQLDMNGEIIGVFENAVEAEKATGVTRPSISTVANGKRNSAGGYKWKFIAP